MWILILIGVITLLVMAALAAPVQTNTDPQTLSVRVILCEANAMVVGKLRKTAAVPRSTVG